MQSIETPAGAAGQALSVTNTDNGWRQEKLQHCLRSGTDSGTYTANADAGTAGLVVFTATAEPGAADSFGIQYDLNSTDQRDSHSALRLRRRMNLRTALPDIPVRPACPQQREPSLRPQRPSAADR
ncbi:hypothetical protein [Rhodohalobacter sp.]|uniref:hypothetical protein n=1 Tax=Rhodohalobacter sp. TaxID=1974210 RepID=UPI002ACDCB29|nr:hypothetical protein [Rhodohalobacter sp.]MDZ7755144.1 hypothetical protein [Rhodohalobacter sp.]